MDRAVEELRREFASVRTGKASPALLDSLKVEAYQTTMPLNQIANVSAPEPQLLVVQPYDVQLAGTISKAIQGSDLGLNPSVDGNLVRIPIPPLTEERRKELVKVVHRMAEEGRIAIRNVRQHARQELQKAEKESAVGEDELRRQLEALQVLTDKHMATVDEALQRREREIMEV